MISLGEAIVMLVAIALLTAFTVARIRGGSRAANCCSPADPRRDLRMRDAFADTESLAPDAVGPGPQGPDRGRASSMPTGQ